MPLGRGLVRRRGVDDSESPGRPAMSHTEYRLYMCTRSLSTPGPGPPTGGHQDEGE